MSNPVREVARRVREFTLLNSRRLTNARVVNHAGVKIAIGDYLSPSVTYCILNGQYERAELKGIRTLLEPSDIVLELGAGVGFISLQCAKVIGGDRVFAYEANPALAPHIRRNYDLNNLHPQLEMCILGDREGEADFFVSDDLWESSMIRPSPEAKPISVPIRSLNQTIRQINPTFLIMDIEGAEFDIIKEIDFHTIRKVAIEIHEPLIGPENVKLIHQRLADAGFVIDYRFTMGAQLVAAIP